MKKSKTTPQQEIDNIYKRFAELDVQCAPGFCNLESPHRMKLARRLNTLLMAIGDPCACTPPADDERPWL
jgi:hypothetical protein